jgi:hypothetical protein
MPSFAEINTERIGTTLKIRVTFELGKDVADFTVEEVKKMVRAELLVELRKSDAFREHVRELALSELLKIMERRVTD